MSKVLEACIRQLAKNSGNNADTIIEQSEINNINYGFDFNTEEYGDLVEMGVIDPLKVVRTAFENAVSMVSNLLTTECLVLDTRPKQEIRKL